MPAYQTIFPPFSAGGFPPRQPHPLIQNRKYGRGLTIMLWTTKKGFNVVPRTQQMS